MRYSVLGLHRLGLIRFIALTGDLVVFLKKAGVLESFIEYMRSLVVKPIEFYSCFISYSRKGEAFARRLYESLQGQNVR